jgi:hypothetical protein
MEKRSRRRIRDLVALPAFQGLSQNEIGCARISMMARSTNAPFKGRIQKRKTNHLQIIAFGSQRTARPYNRATSGLMHCNNKTDFLIAALQTLLNRISFDSSVKKSERQNPETGTGSGNSGLWAFSQRIVRD